MVNILGPFLDGDDREFWQIVDDDRTVRAVCYSANDAVMIQVALEDRGDVETRQIAVLIQPGGPR